MNGEGLHVGIDFGTCNIKVSFYDAGRKFVRQLKLSKDDRAADSYVSNVIAYTAADDFIVGRVAQRRQIDGDQDNVVDLIKRKLELEGWSKKLPALGKYVSAEDVTRDTFAWILRSIQEQGRDVSEAVVTVPVGFSEVQKVKIVRAAQSAGIPVTATITEPLAALFSIEEFLTSDEQETRNVVVFDFGGATLDLCLCRVMREENVTKIKVETSIGVSLGGVDLTTMLSRDVIYKKYMEKRQNDDTAEEPPHLMDDLYRLTDGLKTEIFEDDSIPDAENLFAPTRSTERQVRLTLTREEALQCFEKNGVYDRIRSALDDLFEDSAYVEKNEVHEVRVFGGTSRIREFREVLSDYFGDDVYDPDDFEPDEIYSAVADGAARYTEIAAETQNSVILENSIPFYIGIDQGGKFHKLIQRNERYGFFTPLRGLSTIVHSDSDWRVPLYQSFVPGPVSIGSDAKDGAVYLGSVHLDKSLYGPIERVQYKFGVDESGNIVGRFYDVGEDNETRLREEIRVAVGA